MAGLSSITDIWNNVREVDLRPLRDEALQMVKLAIVGAPGSGRHTLSSRLRTDPHHPNLEVQTPVMVMDLVNNQAAQGADLILLLLNAAATDFSQEADLARSWADLGKKVLVVVNQIEPPAPGSTLSTWVDWGQRKVVFGSIEDDDFLLKELAPAGIELLSERLLPLGRHFPLFRVPIATHLINETSFSNAAYALSTGLAEIIPIFDIPLNVTDMVMLTKSQAFLVYKLGLALGMSTRWQDYLAEFGSVLGGGFLWRQVARSLIGLIPAWGIVPKVGVSYSGTYVVGHVVLQWYLTGRHLSPKQMQAMYVQAFDRGKAVARSLAARVPRPRLRRKPAQLPAYTSTEITIPAEASVPQEQTCPECGRSSASDALFCQYCGHSFSSLEAQPD